MISVITICLTVALSVLAPLYLQDEELEQDLVGYKLADLKLTGSTSPFILEGLRPVFGMETGDPYDPQLIRKRLESIRQFFSAVVFIDFTYIPQIDINHDEKTVSCSFLLVPGRQYRVRKINFSGTEHYGDDEVIRSAFNGVLEEGMVFSSRGLDNAIEKLNELLEIKNLSAKDYELKRSSETSTVDIFIRLQPLD